MSDCALRTYKIKPGRMDEWVAWWRDKIVPYRESRGFDVVGAWINEADNEFVWIVEGRDRSRSIVDLDAEYEAARVAEGFGASAIDELIEDWSLMILNPVERDGAS